MISQRGAWWLLALPLLFLGLFFLYPLVSILGTGVGQGNGFSTVLSDPYYRELFVFTAAQAVASTFFALLIGVPASYVLGEFQFRGRRAFLTMATLPFVLPAVVVAAALLAVFGQNGLISASFIRLFGPETPPFSLQRTVTLVILAHVFYNTPVVLRIMMSHWMTRDKRAEEAARLLGAGPWTEWRRMRLPPAMPSMLSAALLVFVFTFTSFGVVLLLGGSRMATIEVEIYRQAVGLFNLPVAAALSIVQMAFMTLLIVVFTLLDRRAAAGARPVELRRPRFRREWLAVAVTLVGLSLLLILPLVMLLIQSLSVPGAGLSLRGYTQLFEESRRAVISGPAASTLLQSLVIAAVAVVLAIPLGAMAALAATAGPRRWRLGFELLVLLPMSASAVLLGLGFVIALDEPPLDLRTAWILLPIAHALVAIPLVVRTLSPSLRALPPEASEAAQVLGARPRTVWRRILLPLIAPAVTVGALFAFTMSMGEFGATLFIARPDWTTAPLAIYRLLGQAGGSNYQQSLALSSLLLIVCGIAFVAMERLRGTTTGGF